MPQASCRKPADEIVSIDEAMRLGYNWKLGPFELIDKVGASWLAKALEDEGISVPPILKLVGEQTFYRIENGKQQFFGLDGAYHDLVRPDGVQSCSKTSSGCRSRS